MKMYKCLLFFLFISFSDTLYSQILVPDDIDILKNQNASEYTRLNEIFDGVGVGNYTEQLEKVMKGLFNILENDGIIDNVMFNALQMDWENFLEIEVPQKMELIFNEMGWNDNGHKKLWTIVFGIDVLGIIEEDEGSAYIALLNLFDKNDIKIIKEIRDELM